MRVEGRRESDNRHVWSVSGGVSDGTRVRHGGSANDEVPDHGVQRAPRLSRSELCGDAFERVPVAGRGGHPEVPLEVGVRQAQHLDALRRPHVRL